MFEKVVGFLSGKKTRTDCSVVLSPTGNVKGEAKIVCELFKNGLGLYHLRKPRWTREKFAEWLKQIPKEFRARIVVHQFPELVEKFGLGGFHLGIGVSVPGNFTETLSAQCASYADIEQVAPACRYVLLGPIFPSGNRDLTVPARTPAEFAAALSYWRKKGGRAKVFAFGGVNAGNIKTCKKLGFDGFATVSAIWDSEDGPVKAFKALRKKW